MKEISQDDATKLLGEVVVLREALEKTERELGEWKHGFERMVESDRLETEERIHWEEEAEKAESTCNEFRALMIKVEKSLSRYEVVSLDDFQHISVTISGKDAKKICKLMGDTV